MGHSPSLTLPLLLKTVGVLSLEFVRQAGNVNANLVMKAPFVLTPLTTLPLLLLKLQPESISSVQTAHLYQIMKFSLISLFSHEHLKWSQAQQPKGQSRFYAI